MVHKWAVWLHNACRLGVRNGSKRGTKSEVAQKWAGWLHNPWCKEVPIVSNRGTKREVAHKWARWLHNPCRIGGPQRFKAGDKMRGGPQGHWVAT